MNDATPSRPAGRAADGRAAAAPAPATAAPAGPLWQMAYDALSTMIQERALPAGAPVIEQQLAERLGISRTPLRQALQRLEIEGLLRKTAHHSYVVRRVELREYLQSLRVRELLEAEAAALAAARGVPREAIEAARSTLRAVQERQPYDMLQHWRSDDEVHDLAIRNCGNEIMGDMIAMLRVATKLFEIERLAERLEPDSRQHEQILDALAAGDAEAARRAAAGHIRSLFEFAIRTVC